MKIPNMYLISGVGMNEYIKNNIKDIDEKLAKQEKKIEDNIRESLDKASQLQQKIQPINSSERITEIKRQIENGTYIIDPEKIAGQIIDIFI